MRGQGIGQGTAPRIGAGRNQVAGEITTLDDKSLIIKMADGSVTASAIELNPKFLGRF